ncbi:PepSY domain-containing protein [Sphingobium sp. DEHP117]|uniref:PepSY-associated TM helix domain-containing protein n=1 Tax=Sphingobium sp. DEHP117 TaxID=2993436 RepID=UPI0027D70D1B|nr:PepSY domain-containing protein [Sphingobium sp. DEHP117]MDQ4419234.1 PepSY domain-containing protein [Sphingobium sp. DEHP117]
MASSSEKTALYRMLWRWHFYAGLFVMPMVLVLSLTGALYLFKPQIERWEERAFQGLAVAGAVAPSAQRDAALAAFPGAAFHSYRLPGRSGDAALIHIALPGDKGMRDVFVSPQGDVVGSIDPEWRIMQIAHDIHGQLLLGPRGSWLVELAASWAIVMIATGLYLWWPRGRGAAGVLWPRLKQEPRVLWRDLHAVTGFWVSGLALVLLVTGLPWAGVWGSSFKTVREQMGWVKGAQDWTIGGRAPGASEDAGEHALHAEHDHSAMMTGASHHHAHPAPDRLNAIVDKAQAEHLPFPVIVTPPGAPQAFGAKAGPTWTVRSDTQDRPRRITIRYDAAGAQEVSRDTFADKHVIDRVVGYGIAWHEGALFGWVNQLIGLLTAFALVALSVTGFIQWRRRKPQGGLGVPPAPRAPARSAAVLAIGGFFFLTLPLFALSLSAIWLIDRIGRRTLST